MKIHTHYKSHKLSQTGFARNLVQRLIFKFRNEAFHEIISKASAHSTFHINQNIQQFDPILDRNRIFSIISKRSCLI